MQLRDILLTSCAVVPLVSGRSLFDWISRKEDKYEEFRLPAPFEEWCSQPSEQLPQTIGLSFETTLSRPAEIATLEVYVKAAAPTEDEAIKEANAAADRVLEYLNDISRDLPDTIIESTKQFSARVDSSYWDDEYSDFTDFDFEGIEVTDASPESIKAKDNNKKAKARISVRINKTTAVADLKKDLTTKLPVRIETNTGKVTSFDVRVGRIHWSLTDSSKAELKKELRAKAIREAVVEAQDYAEIYGMSSLRPSECVEEYTWVGEKYDWTDDYRDDSVEPKEIEGSTTMKCKFSVETARYGRLVHHDLV